MDNKLEIHLRLIPCQKSGIWQNYSREISELFSFRKTCKIFGKSVDSNINHEGQNGSFSCNIRPKSVKLLEFSSQEPEPETENPLFFWKTHRRKQNQLCIIIVLFLISSDIVNNVSVPIYPTVYQLDFVSVI